MRRSQWHCATFSRKACPRHCFRNQTAPSSLTECALACAFCARCKSRRERREEESRVCRHHRPAITIIIATISVQERTRKPECGKTMEGWYNAQGKYNGSIGHSLIGTDISLGPFAAGAEMNAEKIINL